MRLRRFMWIVTALTGGLALAAAAALTVLTSYLGRATTEVRDSMESVRAAEEIASALLLHDRARFLGETTGDRTQLLRAVHAEHDIARWLDVAERHVGEPDEAALLRELRRRVDEYRTTREQLAARGVSPEDGYRAVQASLDAAHEASEALLQMNVQQAEDMAALARRWDRFGDRFALLGSALVVIASTLIVLLFRTHLYRPLLATRAAIRRFAGGDRDARAAERGVAEIREIARAFNGMADTLGRQREEQLGSLAGIAHDLRTPLSALRLATAAASVPRAPEAQLRRALDLAARQVSRLERMVEDLLDAARIEAGRLELSPRLVDVRPVAAHVIALLEPGAPAHRLTVSTAAVPVPVHADAQRLEQVITNLVGNAIKYSPAGGPVAVSVRRAGGEAVLEVCDAGVGIPPAELEHIFQPFRRGDGARAVAAGAGLGLATARRIVEAHHGRIEVESQPGRGSTFRIRLPLAPAEALMVAEETSPSETG